MFFLTFSVRNTPHFVKNYDGRRHVQPLTQCGHRVSGKRIFTHTVNDIDSWGHLKISRRRLRTYKQFGEIVVDARHAEVRFALEWLSHIVDTVGSKR